MTAPTPTVLVDAPRPDTAPTPTLPVDAPRPVTAPVPTVPVDAPRPVTAPVPTIPAEPPSDAPAEDGPLAAPAGWPDITDELAEVRFLLLQGFEDEAATMLVSLRARFTGHPDLERVDAAPVPPVPIDAAEKRRRDQAVTVRTEPVAAAAAAAAADASRREAAVNAAAAVEAEAIEAAAIEPPAIEIEADAIAIEADAIEADAIEPEAIAPAVIAPAPAPVELPPAVTGATVIAAAPRERRPAVTGSTVVPIAPSERPVAVSGTTVVPESRVDASPPAAPPDPPPAVTGETVIAAAPSAPPRAAAETPPLAPRPVPGLNARNASRVPPRGLTIRSEPVSDAAGASPATDVPPPAARVVRPPDPASLVAVSPIPRPGPAPGDSAAETLEFDVDAEFGEAADGATDPASMSTMAGQRGAAAMILDDDSGETVVDLEFERLDRTVVSRNPPAPPVFDDEPETGTDTRAHVEPVVEPVIEPLIEPLIEPVIEAPDRTVIARAPSAPAPWRGGEDAAAPAPPVRNTVVPTHEGPPAPAPFGGAPPPGSTLVPGTTPPPGGFADEDPGDDAATIALPSLTDAARMAETRGPAWSPPPTPAVTGQTAPPGAMQAAPAAPEPARAPTRGRARKDVRSGGVRLVMLGSRGESVAERSIEPGGFLDLGREAGQPWSDDTFIEPMHARFIAVDGGVRVEELVPTGAVFLRIQGRRPLGEHDQVRVGQSLLTYRRPEGDPNAGPWGSVVMHTAPDGAMQVIPLGNSGVTVGREFGEITLPADTFVSSTHCRVVTDPTGIHIEDLESSNGTYVRMRSGEPLEIGQCVLVGQTQFVVRKG